MSKSNRVNIVTYLSLLLIGLTATASFFTALQSWNHSVLMFNLAFSVNWGCTVALILLVRRLTCKENGSEWKPHLYFVISSITIYILGYITVWGGYLFFPLFWASLIVFAVIIVRSLIALVKSRS